MIRWLSCITLGCLPGVLIFLAGNPRPGVAVIALGASVGALYAAGGVSPARTVKLLVASILAKNLPSLGDRAFEWVDQDLDSESEGDWLVDWLFPTYLASGARWKVICGVGFGLLVGGGVVFHDLRQAEPSDGWMLPFEGAKDSLATQCGLLLLGASIWGAAIGGVFTSTVYRRVLTVAVVSSVVLGAAVGYAGSRLSAVSVASFVSFLLTAGIACGVLLAWILDSVDDGEGGAV